MPELPEVEVVRRGLARWVIGARIETVQVLHPRPVRRHLAGPHDFADRLRASTVTDVARRGKFLWLTLDGPATADSALLAHLGMSGQMLLEPPGAPAEPHLRVRLGLSGGPAGRRGRELRFVDQRMFGGLQLSDLVATPDGLPAGVGGRAGTPSAALLPVEVRHIARDVLDPHLDLPGLVTRMRRGRSGIKRGLLDQGLVSGIGNIYADEALWRARIHYERPMATMPRAALTLLLGHVRSVMGDALDVGGTSFDSLYVDVNGRSGYFERGLAVYGREGLPCLRCGTPIRREAFMNRSSFRCPRCQRRPPGTQGNRRDPGEPAGSGGVRRAPRTARPGDPRQPRH